jgi:hypothetical protein
MKRLMAMGYGFEAKVDKLNIKDKTGKTLFPCNQAEDRIFYLKGRLLMQAGLFNMEEGEWIDPIPESIDGNGKSMRPVKKKIDPKSMTYDEAHDRWGHKNKRLLSKTATAYSSSISNSTKPRMAYR